MKECLEKVLKCDILKGVFICKKCGNIQELDSGKECKVCHEIMDWENSFPPSNALDFVHSAKDLFEQAKRCDKENLNSQYQVLIKEGQCDIDKTLLDKYNNKYQKILEKYPDNDDTFWMETSDKFEDKLCCIMCSEQAIAIFSVIKVFSKNHFRKPYVIMVASLIEQLFNDYFRTVVSRKLTEKGQKIFLDKYETAGIQSAIDIIDSFLDESLYDKMNRYSEGFYDKWAELRRIRNSIIHSNNRYITKVKISQIHKLIVESLNIFSELKGEIYRMEN